MPHVPQPRVTGGHLLEAAALEGRGPSTQSVQNVVLDAMGVVAFAPTVRDAVDDGRGLQVAGFISWRSSAGALAVVATVVASASASASERRIAVLEFRADGIAPTVFARLSDEVRGGVLGAIRDAKRESEFMVMTRESMAVILRDMKAGACVEVSVARA